MIPQAIQEVAPFGVAWMLTYLVHSTVLLGIAWMVGRRLQERPALVAAIWKAALVGGIITASAQAGLGVQPGGWMLEPVPERVASIPPRDGGPLEPKTALVGDERPPSPAWTEVPGPEVDSNPGAAATPASVETPSPNDPPWTQWVFSLWMAGALLCSSSLVRSWRSLRRCLVGRTDLRQGPLLRMLESLRRRAGLRRGIRLSVAPRIEVPIAVGVWRPEICVPPRALEELDAGPQQSLLAHELAHVVRRDVAWRWLGSCIERLLFFQPLNRLANRELASCAEFLCDAWAAAHTEQPLVLAECLADVAGWMHARPVAAVPTMSAPRSILARRIARLVDPPQGFAQLGAPRWMPLALAGVLTLAVVVAPRVSAGHEAARLVGAGPCQPMSRGEPVLAVAPETSTWSMPVLAEAEVRMDVRSEAASADHEPPEAGVERGSAIVSREDTAKQRRATRKARREARKRVRKAFREARKAGAARPDDRALLEAVGGGSVARSMKVDLDDGTVVVFRDEDGSMRVLERGRTRRDAERRRDRAAHRGDVDDACPEAHARAWAPPAPPVVVVPAPRPPSPPPALAPELQRQIQRDVERALRKAERSRRKQEEQLRRRLEQLKRSLPDEEEVQRRIDEAMRRLEGEAPRALPSRRSSAPG